MEPPLVGLTRKQIGINIGGCIRFELKRFPRLNFLEYAFDDYDKQIAKTLKLVVTDPLLSHEWDYSLGCYMKQLASLRHERKSWPIISKCIEEIRQEIEKYDDRIRSTIQRINNLFIEIELVLSKYEYFYEIILPKTRDVQERKN